MPATLPALSPGQRWGEAVAVLANMTMAALKGGGDERRGEDHRSGSGPDGGGVSVI
jgi:hypothetical protein